MDFKLLKDLQSIHAPAGDESKMKNFLIDYVQKNKKKWKVKPELIHGEDFQNCLILKFGNPRDPLKANLDIKKSNFTFNLIKGGSVGFAESYMKNEFETKNLSDLIEVTARNVKQIHKFSGLLDLPIINFFRNIFIKFFVCFINFFFLIILFYC